MKTWASWRNFVAKDPSRCVTLTDLSERKNEFANPFAATHQLIATDAIQRGTPSLVQNLWSDQ